MVAGRSKAGHGGRGGVGGIPVGSTRYVTTRGIPTTTTTITFFKKIINRYNFFCKKQVPIVEML